MKIGLLGGSFDPIHFGHINLAIELMEKKGLDEVWFIPAHLSPHKDNESVSISHRLEMVRAAIENIPYFKCLDIETKRPPPSYTIDTLRHLIEEYPGYEFSLLLGEDCVHQFANWKEAEAIVQLVPVFIGLREGLLPSQEAPFNLLLEGRVATRQMDISSTSVRARLIKNLYCGHLVPAKALLYINKLQLYRF